MGAIEQAIDPVYPVPRFPGYFCDSAGHLYSSFRRGTSKPGGNGYSITPGYYRRLKPKINRHRGGYIYHTLSRAKERFTVKAHRIVCEIFHGQPPPGRDQTRHLNHDTSDNRPDNLAWGSKSENEQDSAKAGRLAMGERHGRAKLTDQTVRQIKAMIHAGIPRRVIAQTFGVSPYTVRYVRRGQHWAHVS